MDTVRAGAQLPVSQEEINYLRTHLIVTAKEAAYKVGDLLVAEDIETSGRRVLGEHAKILGDRKRLLKD